MPNAEYLKELTAPSVKVVGDGPTDPQLFVEYFNTLERTRMQFIDDLASCTENVIRAYLQELEKVVNTIETRHFVGIGDDTLTNMVMGGLEKEAYRFSDCKALDTGLLKSAKKTIEFINTILNVNTEPTHIPVTQPQREEKAEEAVKVLSGTQGLADYLGCSKTKAFEIISSGLLKDANTIQGRKDLEVQYRETRWIHRRTS